MTQSATIYQGGNRYIEIESNSVYGFRIELPPIAGGAYAVQEMFEGCPTDEIFYVRNDEIDALINGLLDAKREYRNHYE